jgi:NAD(P)-dependent dehydrogenase (short-subunit alcohol dehydrogenase family)
MINAFTKMSTLNKVLLLGALGATSAYAISRWMREKNKFDLTGKVVLITGGSRGLGLVLGRLLAAKGARLAICARNTDQLEQARIDLQGHGAEVAAFATDITDTNQVDTLIKDVIRHYGRLDVLINNAGIIQVGPHEAMDIEDFELAMKTNFWAALYTMLKAIPYFKEQGEGRIVNITSIGGKIAVPHLLPYTASKFALVGLSEGLHAELKKHNITVTTVVPGLMQTGSPRNVTVKGNHKAEYAWFKISDSSSILSLKTETAAANIIQALEYGRPEAIFALSAKFASFIQGIAPGWLSQIMAAIDNILPDATPAVEQKGYESESFISRLLGRNSTLAALRNNEA